MIKAIKTTKIERIASFNTTTLTPPIQDTFIFLVGVNRTFRLENLVPSYAKFSKGDVVTVFETKDGVKIFKTK